MTVGAVTDDGHVHMSAAAEVLGVRRDDVAAQTEAALADLRRRRASYRHVRTPVHPGGREVIVVDDGALSGATLAAVVRATRLRKPSRLTVAVPVASRAVAEGLAREVDQFVCLERPERVADLSRHYYSFPKVSEREVLTTLLSAGLAPSLRRPG